jgi:hypothetical protein
MTKAKQNKNNNNNNKRRKLMQPPRFGSVIPSRNLVNYGIARFSRVTDPIVDSAFASPPIVAQAATDAGGSGAATTALSPIGVTGWDSTGSVKKQVFSPTLPWLYNTSRNFGSYRILAANLVIVGNVCSVVPGTVIIHSSRDWSDTGSTAGVIGSGGVMFELASLAARNRVFPLQIDQTWKKVTAETSKVVSGAMVSVNSVNDLLFTNFTWRINGGPASVNCFTMYVEYDVEFANHIIIGFNCYVEGCVIYKKKNNKLPTK